MHVYMNISEESKIKVPLTTASYVMAINMPKKMQEAPPQREATSNSNYSVILYPVQKE